MRPAAAALALLLASCDTGSAPLNQNSADHSAQSACSDIAFEGADFTDCVATPGQHRIDLVIGPDKGAPYRGFAAFAASQPERAKRVVFAVNGGMFDDAGRPIGYAVEGGQRRHDVNRARGPGNFHLLPNGVFLGDSKGWRVIETSRLANDPKGAVQFATQSGPMLVIGGKLHPKFSKDGESRYVRNGVGVDRTGRAHFVISQDPVSFGRFARLFRDRLQTPDALFLDGNVSSVWDPSDGRIDQSVPLGPLIVVEKAAKGGG